MSARTFAAITLIWLSQCVSTTQRHRASVDRIDRVVTWRYRSSSMYSGTEVYRALCVMTAIFSTGCTVGQAASEGILVAIWH